MTIQVLCAHCQSQFAAWEDLVGHTIECPKCGGDVTVMTLAATDDDVVVYEVDDELTLQPPEEITAVSDELQGGESDGVKPLLDEDLVDCPNCGEELSTDGLLCDACGYHTKLKRVMSSDLEDLEVSTATGFNRWYQEQLADDATPSSVRWWALAVGVVVGAIFTIVCFPFSLFIVIPAAIGLGGLSYVRYRATKSGGVDADPVVKIAQKALIALLRLTSWRAPEWPFPKLANFSAANSSFTDEDLYAIAHTGELGAIDLAGTQVTDEGVMHLSDFAELRY
ncbi:MAG: hypothetical protein QF805_30005, partial [Pirellulaceae bacterium]|nr:hypothetical protein [Pirellulaceae bacterium]